MKVNESMWKEARQLTRDSVTYYHQAGKGFSASVFGGQLHAFLEELKEKQEKTSVLFLCIGSDRSTGDSLGPLVGYKLEKRGPDQLAFLGTLHQPVHAINLDETMDRIRMEYPDHIVVAIDASIGRKEHVGYITMGIGSLKPGLGVHKNLGTVGDIYITGIVGSGTSLEPLLLQNTRLSVVMELADCIYEGICASGRI
jgi:putative sporulation protein YyaC